MNASYLYSLVDKYQAQFEIVHERLAFWEVLHRDGLPGLVGDRAELRQEVREKVPAVIIFYYVFPHQVDTLVESMRDCLLDGTIDEWQPLRRLLPRHQLDRLRVQA